MINKDLDTGSLILIDIIVLFVSLFFISVNELPMITFCISDFLSVLKILLWMVMFGVFKYFRGTRDIEKACIYGILMGVIWFILEAGADILIGMYISSIPVGYCLYGIIVVLSGIITMIFAVENDSRNIFRTLNIKSVLVVLVFSILYIASILLAWLRFGMRPSYSIFDLLYVDLFSPVANKIIAIYAGITLIGVNHCIQANSAN